MTLDYATLEKMRLDHPSWRLLRSPQAALVASFLHRVYIKNNTRVIAQANLAEALEDELFVLRERLGSDVFPKTALEYLNDWAANDKGWLRKFYQQGTDEPQFDLMSSTEKAIAWLESLSARSFVGTESRLLTVFQLLKQMAEGTESSLEIRMAELQKRRAEIDAEIARLEQGDIRLLADTSIKDRFQQFTAISRELLADFREVEQNFRTLDRRAREKIALWDSSKGNLLQELMGERDDIADSEQGQSFRAFWDFLMSSQRQDEFTELLARVLLLPAVNELKPDPRTRRIHYDWLEAGEHTQRTVAQLSQQLRRFLDDQAWLENKRIIEILRSIETQALIVRDHPIVGDFFEIDGIGASIDLPMERPLFKQAIKPKFTEHAFEGSDEDIDAGALFSQVTIDKAAISRHIRQSLQDRKQITLVELIKSKPLEHGLTELVCYLQLAGEGFDTVTESEASDTITWHTESGAQRQATLPRIIFVR